MGILSSIGAFFGWVAHPQPPPVAARVYVEPRRFSLSPRIASEEDFRRISDAISGNPRSEYTGDIHSLMTWGYEPESHEIERLRVRIHGTRQDVADYLLKRAVSINQFAREALQQLTVFERAHRDELDPRLILACKQPLGARLYDTQRTIPLLAETLAPTKENGRIDWSYIRARYRHIPPLQCSIPNIYKIGLSTLGNLSPAAPIGMVNRAANCWAISLLQLLLHVPHFKINILDHLPPHLAPAIGLLEQYRLDQAQGRRFTLADASGLRELLHREVGIVEADIGHNADAIEAFSAIAGGIDGFEIPAGEHLDPARHRRITNLHTVVKHKKRYDFPDRIYQPDDYTPEGAREVWDPRAKLEAPIPNQPNAQFEKILEHVYSNPYAAIVDDPLYFPPIGGNPDEGIRLQPVEDSILFQEPPPQLTVGFNRFRFDLRRGIREKVQTQIDIPLHYTLEGNKTCNGRAASYHLQGFIIHHGDTEFGHYRACVRKGATWYLCDDDRVTPISSSEAIRFARNAYLVTYEKEGFLEVEEARERAETRRRERLPVEGLVDHDRCSLDVRSDMLISLTEQFMENPSRENFERFPTTIKNQLAFIKWIEDGRPDEPEYGMNALLGDPEWLVRPCASSYFSSHGNSVMKQLWYRNVYLNKRPLCVSPIIFLATSKTPPSR